MTLHHRSTKDLIKLLIIRDPEISVADIDAALKGGGRQLTPIAISSVRREFRHTLRLLHNERLIAEPLAARLDQEREKRRVEDTILTGLRDAPSGLTRTQISELFSRNQASSTITATLAMLAAQGKAKCKTKAGDAKGGRPREVWTAVR